jgi:hypothetical protein
MSRLLTSLLIIHARTGAATPLLRGFGDVLMKIKAPVACLQKGHISPDVDWELLQTKKRCL